MQTTQPIPSIASIGASIGRDAAQHLDILWRDLMKPQGSIETDRYFRLITGEAHPLGNVAFLREASDANVVKEAVAPLLDISKPSAVLFVAGLDDAVSEQLTAQGFAYAGSMPAMAIDISTLAPTKLAEGCELVRVTSPEDATAWTDAVTAGFELPRGLARLLSPEANDASTEPDAAVQFFGIRRDGKMLAASMLYLASGLAGIYCVSTLPEERGQGLGAHVTAEALRAANRVGYGVGVLQSSPSGHSVYKALGFQDVESVPMFVRMPTD